MLELLVVGALSVGSVAQAPEPTRPVASSGHAAPYERLFAVAPITAPGVPTPKPETHQPVRGGHHTVFVHPQWDGVERGPCNMPVIVGDASADPGILLPKKHSNQFKIRVIAAAGLPGQVAR